MSENLWCDEFNKCIGQVLKKGADKYAPHDWEQPDARSINHPKNCHSMFNHLAREFVYLENKALIQRCEAGYKHLYQLDPSLASFVEPVKLLLDRLRLDEMGTRHTQHIATRACMGYTREERGLEE